MPKFKNSNATFLVIFKQCVLIYSNFGLAIKKIDSLQKKNSLELLSKIKLHITWAQNISKKCKSKTVCIWN